MESDISLEENCNMYYNSNIWLDLMECNMSLQIGLRDANQHFAQYINLVEQGEEILITRRGKAIAKLLPVSEHSGLTKAQQAAWERTKKRMQKGYKLGGKKIKRDDIYDR